MGSQIDGSEGGIFSFQSCVKQSRGYRDRILERYPPSKSQSRFFTTTDVQCFDVPIVQMNLSGCVQTSRHHSSAIAFPLLSQPLAYIPVFNALFPACLGYSTDVSNEPGEYLSSSFHTPRHRSIPRARYQNRKAFQVLKAPCCNRHML